MKTITLFLASREKGWMAKYSDPEIIALFGTDVLPTAFTSQAEEETVLSAIRRLNPGVKVEVA